MRNCKLIAFFLLILLAHTNGLAQRTAASGYIIRNVNVISPENKHPNLGARDVYIQDGRIDKIAKSSKRLSGNRKTIIDGTGKFLLPGLADMHAHIPSENQEKYLLMNLLAGVTTLRSMRGDTSHISLKRKIAKYELVGPDLLISAPPITARMTVQEKELPDLVAGFKRMGFDLIKVLSVPDSTFFETLMAAAKSNKMLVAGHSPGQVSVKRVVESGYSSIEHLQGLINGYQENSDALGPLINSLKKNNTYSCPTLDWYFITHKQFSLEELRARKGLEYLDETLVKKWIAQVKDNMLQQNQGDQDSLLLKQKQERQYIQNKLGLVKILNDANAPLLLSPDASTIFAVPGFNMHEEMKLYSRAGISNQDILKVAVYNPAQYMGKQKEQGRIAPGMKADLVLLSQNPLDSIENTQGIEAVIKDGIFLKTSDLIRRIESLSNI